MPASQPPAASSRRRRRDPVRDQRVDARRSQILDAAVQVFASRGFHQATVRDIAKRARVADGTIYLYFKNKGDLVLAILNRINETEVRGIELAQGLAVEVDVRAFFLRYLRHRLDVLKSSLRDLQAVLPDILRDPTLRRRYLREVLQPTQLLAEPLFAGWAAQGKLHPLDPRLLVRALPGLFLGLLVLRMLGDGTVDDLWDTLPEQITELLFDGLQPAGAAPIAAAALQAAPPTTTQAKRPRRTAAKRPRS